MTVSRIMTVSSIRYNEDHFLAAVVGYEHRAYCNKETNVCINYPITGQYKKNKQH